MELLDLYSDSMFIWGIYRGGGGDLYFQTENAFHYCNDIT